MKTQTQRLILAMFLGGAAALAAQIAPPPPPPPEAPVLAVAPAAPAPAPLPALAAIDVAAPAPQALPAPPAPPAPQVVVPAAPAPPAPPSADWELFSQDWQDRVNELAQDAADKALMNQDKLKDIQDKVWQAQELAQEKMKDAQDKAWEAQEKAFDKAGEKFALAAKPFNFNLNFDLKSLPFALQSSRALVFAGQRRMANTDGLYERGRRELDARNWDQALTDFSEVAARGGAHADGALYWKAYALNKLGRRDEALAAIAELRKNTSSRWLDDAAALEVEVKQSSGGTVAPDSTSDDEIKLLALNGLMQSDPDRAYPYLEKMLKSAVAPRLKEQTLYVLAQSNTPKAQQELLQIAKGGGNPDLQITAIRYLSAVNRRQGNNNQVLFDIYNSSNDTAVKRECLNALSASRDTAHLAEIARNEKNHDLQMDAIRRLGGMNNAQPAAADALVAIYSSSPDKDTKHEIINVLSGQRNAKAVVDLGRKEKDLEMKKYIVERVMGMNTPESKQFLEEILK